MEAKVGESAGKVWQALHANGPMDKSALGKATGLSSDLLNQGIGWLAREGKIDKEVQKKKQVFKLRR